MNKRVSKPTPDTDEFMRWVTKLKKFFEDEGVTDAYQWTYDQYMVGRLASIVSQEIQRAKEDGYEIGLHNAGLVVREEFNKRNIRELLKLPYLIQKGK